VAKSQQLIGTSTKPLELKEPVVTRFTQSLKPPQPVARFYEEDMARSIALRLDSISNQVASALYQDEDMANCGCYLFLRISTVPYPCPLDSTPLQISFPNNKPISTRLAAWLLAA
jgi:hypothetical protein